MRWTVAGNESQAYIDAVTILTGRVVIADLFANTLEPFDRVVAEDATTAQVVRLNS